MSRILLTVDQFSKKHPAFPVGGLRWMLFHSTERKDSKGRRIPSNGMEEAGVIVRVGRKVLLDEERFFAWLDSRQKHAA